MFSTPVNAEFIKETDASEPQPATPEPPSAADQEMEAKKLNPKAAEQQPDPSANTPKDKPKTKPASGTATGAKTKAGGQKKAKTVDKVKPAAKKDGKQTEKKQAKQVDKKDTKAAAKKTVKVISKKDSKKADATSASDSQTGKDEL